MIVNPTGENRGFHRHRPGLRKRLHPVVQFPSRCPNLAFLVHLTARILDAVADGLPCEHLVRCNTYVLEEPPWLLSESTFPLSSAFSTPRAPPRLSIQTIRSGTRVRRAAPGGCWELNYAPSPSRFRNSCLTPGYAKSRHHLET